MPPSNANVSWHKYFIRFYLIIILKLQYLLMSTVKLIHNNRALGKGDDDTYSVEMSMVSLNFSQSGFPVRSDWLRGIHAGGSCD